jgi:hypothetical protein
MCFFAGWIIGLLLGMGFIFKAFHSKGMYLDAANKPETKQ